MTDESPLDPTASGDLVRRAKGGDRASFDQLIRRSEDRLTRLVHARMGAELRQFEESRDLVQSALTDAVAALPRFEYRGEGSFLRWLTTIAEHKLRHRIRDLHRQKREPNRLQPLPAPELEHAGTSPSQAAAGRELERRYHKALENLDPTERELLLLHLDVGCSHEEIAATLDLVSAEAVRKRVARALAKLERTMNSRQAP